MKRENNLFYFIIFITKSFEMILSPNGHGTNGTLKSFSVLKTPISIKSVNASINKSFILEEGV